MYDIKLQYTKSKKVCVCFVSKKNGKLILKGEPVTRKIDAIKVGCDINEAMGNTPPPVLEILAWNHKWPGNAGPKPKKK